MVDGFVALVIIFFNSRIHVATRMSCMPGREQVNEQEGPGPRPPRSSRQRWRVNRRCGLQTLKGRVRGTSEGDGEDWQTRAGGEGPRPEDVALACPPEESQALPHPMPTSPEPQIKQTEIFRAAQMFVPRAIPFSRPAVSTLRPKEGSRSGDTHGCGWRDRAPDACALPQQTGWASTVAG